MAMDFFEHQEQARRKTGRLVWLFIAAVFCMMLSAYLAVLPAYYYFANGMDEDEAWSAFFSDLGLSAFNPYLMLTVGGTVLLVVGFSSLFKIHLLAGGGRVVAESLGGRLLDRGSYESTERQLLNIVEEMAIASGVAVPDVYLMDHEEGINAFAAGYSSDHAVIGVTRGTIDLLSRDELQGVIAHEYSHILNGDMRLNIRLMGALFGILVIGLIGKSLAEGSRYFRFKSKNGDDAGPAAFFIVTYIVSLALMAIGYIGFFFGGLIKAAVSRQREFLADASAVQFTRYPEGIGGALKKIGGYSAGSRVLNPKADEVSHMFFSQGVSAWIERLNATHPPLAQRIRRIEPSWDGRFPVIKKIKHEMPGNTKQQVRADRDVPQLAMLDAGAERVPQSIRPAVQYIGQVTEAHVQQAHALIDSIPIPVIDATHSSLGACATIFAVLLSPDESIRADQIHIIRDQFDTSLSKESAKLGDALRGMDHAARLPLIDMAMPALHNLAIGQYHSLKKCVVRLIKVDQRVDLFEWMLSRALLHKLSPHFEPNQHKPRRVKYYSLIPMRQPLAVLLSALARQGHTDPGSIQHAFEQGVRCLALDPAHQPVKAEDSGLRQIGEALTELNTAGPREKKAVINACAVCITADKQVTPAEAELLRAVCDSLDCPMPPLLPGQALV